MGVILDSSTEGYIINPQDMVQSVIEPLQSFSTANGSLFGGVMAWDYAVDLSVWNGAWGSTAGQALGIAPGVAETPHAGPSRRQSRCGAGAKTNVLQVFYLRGNME